MKANQLDDERRSIRLEPAKRFRLLIGRKLWKLMSSYETAALTKLLRSSNYRLTEVSPSISESFRGIAISCLCEVPQSVSSPGEFPLPVGFLS